MLEDEEEGAQAAEEPEEAPEEEAEPVAKPLVSKEKRSADKKSKKVSAVNPGTKEAQ